MIYLFLRHLATRVYHAWPYLDEVLTGCILIAWIAGIVLLLINRLYYPKLGRTNFSREQLSVLPKLSILVPACDEAATLEKAMKSLLALNYPDLEIIAVNDRSTDETGEILDRLAQTDPRLKVRHISELPAGWLGKNHALHVAGEEATGEWLLFTDADIVYKPDTLLLAVAYSRSRKIDHLVLWPRCDSQNFWERLFFSYFSLMFCFRVRTWDVADPRSSAYFGFGAFNLVRTEAYRMVGGHSALPMEVTDDTKLGKVLKCNGYRTAVLDGSDHISLRWVVGLSGVLNGFVKNAYASFEFNLPRAFIGMAGIVVTAVYPAVALFLPFWPARALAFIVMLTMIGGAATMRKIASAEAWYGLAYPLAALLIVLVILRSIWFTHRQNGIIWRGTLYPLEDLKKGIV